MILTWISSHYHLSPHHALQYSNNNLLLNQWHPVSCKGKWTEINVEVHHKKERVRTDFSQAAKTCQFL
jgi:hypothetical protein